MGRAGYVAIEAKLSTCWLTAGVVPGAAGTCWLVEVVVYSVLGDTKLVLDTQNSRLMIYLLTLFYCINESESLAEIVDVVGTAGVGGTKGYGEPVVSA